MNWAGTTNVANQNLSTGTFHHNPALSKPGLHFIALIHRSTIIWSFSGNLLVLSQPSGSGAVSYQWRLLTVLFRVAAQRTFQEALVYN